MYLLLLDYTYIISSGAKGHNHKVCITTNYSNSSYGGENNHLEGDL
jgi:hypothetical protein